ncbi:MAG: DUF2029 domain-containing protein [Armatimonadia bacterium]|nr:DUF2029 domain-containing protein [Armatimonadia bacterium]
MITDTFAGLLGLAIAACLFLARFLGDGPEDTPSFVACTVAAFALYAAALRLLPDSPTPERRQGRLLLVAIIAVVVHIAPFRGKPVRDTDAYRYHWDGMVLARGLNPYQHAPEAPELRAVRDEFYDPMDYKSVKTIYPPLTQAVLAATYFADPTPRRALVLAMVGNLLCLWPLAILLRRHRVGLRWLAAYGWNPLLAVEFATGGHLDPLSVMLLLWALVLLGSDRPIAAGVMLALAILSKTQILVVTPVLARRLGWRGITITAIVCTAAVAPFVATGGDLLAGAGAYMAHWEFNSGLYALAKWAMGSAGARALAAFVVVTVVTWLALAGADPVDACGLALGALLLVSPAVFPWYLSWVLPFACLRRSVTGLVASLALLASHFHQMSVALGKLLRWPEYALIAGAAAVELWRRRSTPSRG